MKKKAVFITNIPSPYRVDFFSYMQKNFPEYEFHIIFSGAGMENRKWNVEMEEIEHYHFLKSKTIIIRKRFDDRYVFIPTGVEKTLKEIAPDVVFAMEYNDDPSCSTLVPEEKDTFYQLDGWYLKFQKKYRKSTAAVEKLYHKEGCSFYREQHSIEKSTDRLRCR